MAKDYDDDDDDRRGRSRNSRDDDDAPRRRRDDDDAPRRRRDEDDAPRRRDDDYDSPRSRGRSERGAGLGLASLIVGIISIPMCICSWFSLPVSIAAIIMGFVSRSQGGPRGTNTGGIICGFVNLLLVGILVALVLSGAIDENKIKAWQQQQEQQQQQKAK